MSDRALELWIAGRYLRSRRGSRFVSLITFIATAGVALGVCALIVVTGVMEGLQRELREKILVANPHIRVLTYGEGLRLDDWQRVRDVVLQQEDVVAAAPFVLSQGIVSAGADYAEGVGIIGIDTDTGAMSVTRLPQSFTAGDLRFATRLDSVEGGVILGGRLAERLSAYPGSRVTIVSPAGSAVNRALGAVVPRFYQFEVSGTFETGMYEYDNTYVIMPLETAQRFAGLENAVSGIEVRVRDPWETNAVRLAIEDALRFPYRAMDWRTQNRQLFSALKLEKFVMGGILLLIVLVAAFNIVSTLTMSVSDRTREIGILRAMGMTARQIRRIFLAQGMAVGIVGTAIGVVSGIAVGLALGKYKLIRIDPSVYLIDHMPVQMSLADVVIIALASLLIALLATLYPSGRAAKLRPVEAISHE